MKKTTVAKWAFKAARKNPRMALSVAMFAVERRHAIRRTLLVGRATSRLVSKAADRSVQNELRAATANLGQAFARARKVGVLNALEDRKVAKSTQKGLGRASTALAEVRKSTGRPSHKLRNAVLGMGLVAGGLQVWKRSAAA